MEYSGVSNAVSSEQFKLERLKFKLFMPSITKYDKSKKRTQTTRTKCKIKNIMREGKVKELELHGLKATTDRNYFSAFTRNGQNEI